MMAVQITWFLVIPALVTLVFAALSVWRMLDKRTDKAAWKSLMLRQPKSTPSYAASMVKGLPEPAQRYFNYAIAVGTPLQSLVQIEMIGEFGSGSREAPRYRSMQATEILEPPFGFVWRLNSGSISGSDGLVSDTSWTRFWLFNVIPVVRKAGADHRRSAFGRLVAEGAFWAPASLLPGDHVRWQAMDADSARAIVSFGDWEQAVDITVDASGAPKKVLIQRWSNENPDKSFRAQPFGGYLSEFRVFGGYRLATRVEGGNHIGTPDYFPFFKADVLSIEFPRDRVE